MKNTFKRITSAILSLLIVISACSGTISVFATGTDNAFSYQLEEANNTNSVPDASTSLVTSTTVTYKDWNGITTEYSDESIIPQISDGVFTKFDLSAGSYAKTINGVTTLYRDGTIYTDVVHTLDGVCDISDVLVVNRAATVEANKYSWISYEIYASNQLDKLFSGEPIFTYDNTGANFRTQRFKTTNFKAKYVAMRVTASTSSDELYEGWVSSSYKIRMDEFNVYGSKIDDYGKPTEEDALDLPAAPARSVVKNIAAQYSNGTENTAATLSSVKPLYDGDLSNEVTVDVTASPYYNSETDNYVDVILQLKGEQNINDIYIAHSTESDYIPREYELYIGDSDDELFDEEPYYTYSSDDPKATQHYEVSGYKGSYVGMRIKKPHADGVDSADSLVRLREFNVYTDEEAFTKVTECEDYDIPEGTDLSVLDNLTHPDTTVSPVLNGYEIVDGTVTKLDTGVTGDTPISQLSDGNLTTKVDFNKPVFATIDSEGNITDYTENRQRYLDIYYDLKDVADLSHIVLGFPTNPGLVPGDFEVYVSDERGSLFSGTPYVTVDNATDYRKYGTNERMDIINFDKSDDVADTARFVGIRIYNPISEKLGASSTTTLTYGAYNAVHTRLTEFAVYGKYVDESFDSTKAANVMPTSDIDITEIETTYGQNILKSENLSVRVDGQGPDTSTDVDVSALQEKFSSNVLSRTGDGFGEIHTDLNGAKAGRVSDFIVELDEGDLTAVKGFIFQSTWKESAYMTSAYQVYIAEDREDLFSGEPVFDYNEESQEITYGQVVEFPKAVKGKWFAIRILNPIYTATTKNTLYLRASVLFAWGEGAEATDYQTNLAQNMPMQANLVSGANSTPVSDENLTALEQKQLTDGSVNLDADGNKIYAPNTETSATVATENKDLELIYNLCEIVEVSKISVNALIDASNGFETLKVYANNSGVFGDDDLVGTYTVNETGAIEPTITLENATQMQYVRFVFEGTKENVCISSINIFATDAQKFVTRNVALDKTSADYEVYMNGEEYSVYPKLLNSLADGSDKTFFVLNEGLVGEDTYDVLMNLGGLKTISNIQLSYLKNYEESWPGKINIYLGETKEDAMNATEPVFVALDDDVENGVLSFDIKPCFASYIRLEFVEFNSIEGYLQVLNNEETGKYLITSTLADVKVMGTDTGTDVTPEENLYTVKFVGLDNKVIKTQVVGYGEAATAPTDTYAEGHVFTGWDKDFSNITENTVVTAQYTVNTYTVTFVDYNGAVLKTETVEYGKGATAPADPQREGYDFTGWDKEFGKITGNLVVTANYVSNSHTVTFVDWDDTVLKTETVEHGKAATAPADPERKGYTFTGWDVAFDNITGNLTVTAQYTINTYTVEFRDATGVLKVINVTLGSTVREVLSEEEIDNIENSVRDVYGYTVMRDDNGSVVWNKDLNDPIVESTVIEARYNRDMSLTTSVTVVKVDGTKPYDNKLFAYDTAIIVEDALANSWEMNNTIVATGQTLELYACGSTMYIVAKAEVLEADEVSIVGKINEGTDFRVFAHANPNPEKTIVKYGFIFGAKTYMNDYYGKEDGRDFTLDDEDAFEKTDSHNKLLQKTEKVVENVDAVDFMILFQLSKSTAERFARAYIVYDDGTVAYSNIISNQTISDGSQFGYAQLEDVTGEMDD